MSTRYATKAYHLEVDRFGFYILTRLRDGFDAFFQGEDADLWEHNMTAIEGIKEWRAGNSLDASFNFLCSGYDDVLSAPGLDSSDIGYFTGDNAKVSP